MKNSGFLRSLCSMTASDFNPLKRPESRWNGLFRKGKKKNPENYLVYEAEMLQQSLYMFTLLGKLEMAE